MSRFTNARKEIVAIISSQQKPVLVEALIKHLSVNKTTIYRQLHSLVTEGIIREVDFSDRKKRYEMANSVHHHHLVCEDCGRVDDIEIDETPITQQIKNSSYKINRHSLEFFGQCANCQ